LNNTLCDYGIHSYGELKVPPTFYTLEWEKAVDSLKPSLVFESAVSETVLKLL
jgi:hypothetical protein